MLLQSFLLVTRASTLLLMVLVLAPLGCRSRERIAQEVAARDILREILVPAIDMQEAPLRDVVEYLNFAVGEYGRSKVGKEAIIVFECPAPLSQRRLKPIPIAKDQPIDAGMTKIVSIMDLVDEVCSHASVNLIIKGNRAVFISK